jgi:hypothetical protein
MDKQYLPLPRECTKLAVSGGRPPYTIKIKDSQGTVINNVRVLIRMRDTLAFFKSYEEACSVAEDLLRDLKKTLEEDKHYKTTYPPLTISLDDL